MMALQFIALVGLGLFVGSARYPMGSVAYYLGMIGLAAFAAGYRSILDRIEDLEGKR